MSPSACSSPTPSGAGARRPAPRRCGCTRTASPAPSSGTRGRSAHRSTRRAPTSTSVARADLAVLEEAIAVADGFDDGATPAAEAAAGSCASATGAGRCGRRPPRRRRAGRARRAPARPLRRDAAPPGRRGRAAPASRPRVRRRGAARARAHAPQPRHRGGRARARRRTAACGRPPRRKAGRGAGRTSRRSSPRSRSRSRPRRSRRALAAGERRTVAARTAIATPGRWRLDVLALLTAALPYEGDSLRLGCVLLAGPVVVAVSDWGRAASRRPPQRRVRRRDRAGAGRVPRRHPGAARAGDRDRDRGRGEHRAAGGDLRLEPAGGDRLVEPDARREAAAATIRRLWLAVAAVCLLATLAGYAIADWRLAAEFQAAIDGSRAAARCW